VLLRPPPTAAFDGDHFLPPPPGLDATLHERILLRCSAHVCSSAAASCVCHARYMASAAVSTDAPLFHTVQCPGQSPSTIEAAFTAKHACTALQDDQWNTEAARLTMSWSRSVDPSGKQQPHYNLTRTLRASLEACMTP